MRHPVSGELKELTREEFFALFDPSVHDQLSMSASLGGTEAMVVMENLQTNSVCFGMRSAIAVGSGRCFPLSAVESPGFRLGEVPSRFQYPVALWRVSESPV